MLPPHVFQGLTWHPYVPEWKMRGRGEGERKRITDLFKNYPFLEDFVSTKPSTTLLLKQVKTFLADQATRSCNFYCPVLGQGEFENIQAAWCYLQAQEEINRHFKWVDLAKKGMVPNQLQENVGNQKKQNGNGTKQKKKNIHHWRRKNNNIDPKYLRYSIPPSQLCHRLYAWYSEMFLSFMLIEHPVGAHQDTHTRLVAVNLHSSGSFWPYIASCCSLRCPRRQSEVAPIPHWTPLCLSWGGPTV